MGERNHMLQLSCMNYTNLNGFIYPLSGRWNSKKYKIVKFDFFHNLKQISFSPLHMYSWLALNHWTYKLQIMAYYLRVGKIFLNFVPSNGGQPTALVWGSVKVLYNGRFGYSKNGNQSGQNWAAIISGIHVCDSKEMWYKHALKVQPRRVEADC